MCVSKHLNNLEVTPLLEISIGSHYANATLIVCHILIDSECSFLSIIMEREVVLVLVLVWCTQTVQAQQGQ